MGNQLSRKKALYLILAMQCMSQTRKAITKYICSNMFPLHVGWQTADNRRAARRRHRSAAPHYCRRTAVPPPVRRGGGDQDIANRAFSQSGKFILLLQLVPLCFVNNNIFTAIM